MPQPAHTGIGPDTSDGPHAITLYNLGFLSEAVDNGRVYMTDRHGGIEKVKTIYTESSTHASLDDPSVVAAYGSSDRLRFQLTREVQVKDLIIDPDLPTR
jgi:hypothetical protein